MNIAVWHDHRSESQLHTEFAKLDRDGSEPLPWLDDREGKFAAGKKACFLAVHGDQIGFCKNFKQVLLLKRLNQGAQINVLPEKEKIKRLIEIDIRLIACAEGAARASTARLKSAKLACGAGSGGVCGARAEDVQSQLRNCRPVHLGKLHFQQHFLCSDRAERQHVDDVLGVSRSHHSSMLLNV